MKVTASVAGVGAAASLTVASTEKVSTTVGVPLISPSVLSDRPSGRPVASQVYGVVPPEASSENGVIGASTAAVWAPGSVADRGASPAVEPVGVGVAAVKSAALSSVSAPEAARWADVVLVSGVPVLAVSKVVGPLP